MILIVLCCIIGFACYTIGFLLGGRLAIKNFIEPTCGMSVMHDQYSGAIESITYYYSEAAYKKKIKELKYQDCEEILNEGNNETLD